MEYHFERKRPKPVDPEEQKEKNRPVNDALRAGRGVLVYTPEQVVSQDSIVMNQFIRDGFVTGTSDDPSEAAEAGRKKGAIKTETQPVRNDDGTYRSVKPDANAGAGTGSQPSGKKELTMSEKLRIINDNLQRSKTHADFE